jgi:uncharacterized protein YheU (UPF0270 family)
MVLLVVAFAAAAVSAQPPVRPAQGRDLEAEMNALKSQVQRFEVQASDRGTILTPLEKQVADLRRQVEAQQSRIEWLDRRLGGVFFNLFALFAALYHAGQDRQ